LVLQLQEEQEAKIPVMMVDRYLPHWGAFPDVDEESVGEGIKWEDEEEQGGGLRKAFPCHGKVFFQHSESGFGLCPP